MPVQLSVDRFEGDALAVLATKGGTSVDVPRSWLPAGARPGDVLTLSLELDEASTARLAAETKAIQRELKATEPGGDLKL